MMSKLIGNLTWGRKASIFLGSMVLLSLFAVMVPASALSCHSSVVDVATAGKQFDSESIRTNNIGSYVSYGQLFLIQRVTTTDKYHADLDYTCQNVCFCTQNHKWEYSGTPFACGTRTLRWLETSFDYQVVVAP